MPKNTKQTNTRFATKASQVLRDGRTSKTSKAVVGSVSRRRARARSGELAAPPQAGGAAHPETRCHGREADGSWSSSRTHARC